MLRIIEFFTRNRLFSDLLTLFIVIAGIVSALLIRREVFPNVNFDVITIGTTYPGASPEEVEKLITNPIEQDLKEVDGIKKLRSYSTDGRSHIVAFLDPDQTTEAKAKSDIQDVVDLYTPPEGAEETKVIALQSKQQPVIEVAVVSDIPEIELRSIVKDLEKELESVPGVAKTVHKGIRDIEIQVLANPAALQRLSVSLDEVVSALKFQNKSIPAGTIEPLSPTQNEKETLVRTIGDFRGIKDVEDTVIRSNELGQPIRIRDVAAVSYNLEKPTIINRTNGHPSLTLTVLKKEQADAIRMVDMVIERAQKFQDEHAHKFSTSYINDFSQYIRRRLSILTTNMVFGLILVLLTLTLFLPFRTALLTSMGILISFLGTLMVLYSNNQSINLISLLGLIIVSGMLVDDAIVVADNVVRHMKKGGDRVQNAINGAFEIWPAVTASVLTTVIAFLPMLFMSGIFGKFIKQIPMGVVVALLFSLGEALLILPQHFAHYARLEKKQNPNSFTRFTLRFQSFWDNKLVPRYLNLVTQIINKRYIAAAFVGVFFIFSLGVAKFGLKLVLFPPEGIEIFYIRAKAPTGFSLKQTTDAIKPIEDLVAALPKEELQDFVTTIGLVQQDANDPNTKRGNEYAQIAVYLTPEPDRDRYAIDIIEDLRLKIGKPEILEELTFERMNSGPPMGKPVSLGVRGKTYDKILLAVAELKEKIKDLPGLIDLSDSYVSGKNELHIIVNRAEAAAAGLSVTQVGTTVRAALDGIVATSIQELEDEIDVRVSFSPEDKTSADTLGLIKIPNKMGNLIPLTRIAKIEKAQGIAVFQHEGNEREVKVTASLNTDITSSTETNNIIRKLLPEIMKNHPDITVDFGGEDEDTQESLASLVRAFAIAFAGIFLVLILTFKNLFQPFLVILTIPLGIMAVIWTLFIARMPLSFMAMLGIIALAGVIVNNAIVLIDFVNSARRDGENKIKSIITAAELRLKPIFLTSVTTVAGLLPTAHGIGGLDKFVVPIAMSLGYGIMFGSLLTCLFFPAAIAIMDDFQEFIEKKLN
ncbi:MAG: efflux RND transporter permease subunit [Bdellovibrionales bacterium]|nr:efflux RND transporter permease subunit [Bdellovibrionales bacterium]